MSAAGATASEDTSGGDAGQLALACDVAASLSEPIRLRILCALLDSPQTVKQLWTALELPQPNVSHHLGLLLRAGLVSRRRAGRAVVYALGPLVAADGDSLIIRAGPLGLQWRVRC